jgi:hypothetical protein
VLATFAALAVLGVLYVATIASIQRYIYASLKNGDSVGIRLGSVRNSIPHGECEINLKTSSGRNGRVVLYEDWFNLPVIVLPATASNVFLCVYDYDTEFRLLKINLNQPPHLKLTNTFLKANVIDSTCQIDAVEANDPAWAEAHDRLQELPARDYKRGATGLNLLFCYLQTDRKLLLGALRNNGRAQYTQ